MCCADAASRNLADIKGQDNGTYGYNWIHISYPFVHNRNSIDSISRCESWGVHPFPPKKRYFIGHNITADPHPSPGVSRPIQWWTFPGGMGRWLVPGVRTRELVP